MTRPHVIMFLTSPMPFGEQWAKAASRVAHVTAVSWARRGLSWPPVRGSSCVAVDPSNTAAWELSRSPLVRLRPARVFRPLFHRVDERRIEALLDAIERQRPIDVVHTHFFPMWQLHRVARRRGIPLVHTEHSSGLTDQPVRRKALSGVGRRSAAALFREATFVLPVSRFLERSIRAAGFEGNFRVVPNPVDTARFKPTPLPDHSREVVVATVGRLAPEKSLHLLLEAFAILRRTVPNARLRVAGRGPEESRLRRRAAELGIARAVRFEGFVPREEVPRFLSECHVYASTSRVETFGLAVAEAIAAGRPVVASDVGALAEQVIPAGGRLVATGPGEAERFAEALACTVEELSRVDPQFIAEVAEARFSEAAVARQLSEVYALARG